MSAAADLGRQNAFPYSEEAIDREICRRSLRQFVELAWHVLEPEEEFVPGRVIDAICEHLQAVTEGRIKRLLINVPPGTAKSLLASVFWPAWEWGPRGLAHHRFFTASHEMNLSLRDNRRMKKLVESDWYQRRWPLPLSSDQHAKLRFENHRGGFRTCRAMSSLTGERGHRLVIDDPHAVKVKGSSMVMETDAVREATVATFRESATSRLVNRKTSAIVVIQQRTNLNDVAGWILANKRDEYACLILPMRYVPERHCVTEIGFEDWRTEPGELLFADRFSEEEVASDEHTMGDYAVAAQFQQDPVQRSGNLFKVERFEIVPILGEEPVAVVRGWDKAATEGGTGAESAGVKLGWLPKLERFIVLDVIHDRMSVGRRRRTMIQTAALDGSKTWIVHEQEPGSGGKESAENTTADLSGYKVEAVAAANHGSKIDRAEPYAIQVEAGKVLLLEAPWNAEFIAQHRRFAQGIIDIVDAGAIAFNKCAKLRQRTKLRLYST